MKSIIKKFIDNIFKKNFKYKQSSDYFWKIRNKSLFGGGIKAYIYRIKYSRYQDRYNAFIPLAVQFKNKPMFPHGINGVFISSGAKLGKDCTIFHQVTIGSNTLQDSSGLGAPTIGNSVYIGCGAKIIGNVTIGDNVRIGANCVITKDVPSNCTVVLPQPRIIQKEYQDNTFVCYTDIKE